MTVPDVNGPDRAGGAEPARGDQGLAVGTVEEVDDPETEQDKIIDSNPGAGTSVGPAAPRSTCASAPARSQVPNVVGKSQSEAQTTLIAGVNLQVETKFKATNDAPEGTVISQSPKDGTVDIGGTVKITVAQKPAPTVTPTTVTTRPRPRHRRRRATPTATTEPPDLLGPDRMRAMAARTAPPSPQISATRAARLSPEATIRATSGGVVHERAEAHRALHGVRHRRTAASQLASIRWPPWVSTDSGWNCTPCSGRVAVAHRHDDARTRCVPLATSSSGSVAGSMVSEW